MDRIEDRIQKLREQILELRESGAEPEDIALLVQELNMELARRGTNNENKN